MHQQHEHITELVLKTWREEATEEEQNELREWANASPENRELLEQFENTEWVRSKVKAYDEIDIETPRQEMWARIEQYEEKEKVRSRTIWRSIAVAAAIVAGIVIWKWWPTSSNKIPAGTVAQTDSAQTPRPGSDKAILKLANGSSYILQSKPDGLIATQNNLDLYKQGVQVVCKKVFNLNQSNDVAYCTLEVPRGGQYQLLLPDGTKVWLNSASTIRFPSADTGIDRVVTLTGEAYFEVQQDSTHPFVVQTNTGRIRVLGTHFTVNAYEDEHVTKASLLEGKLKMAFGANSALVLPNQSAIVSPKNNIEVVPESNMDKYVGWTKGRFIFENDSLVTVVKHLARWYDMKVKFVATPNILVTYSGERNKPIQTVTFNLHDGNPNIHITISKDTLIVYP